MPFIALTATASTKVAEDVMKLLKLRMPVAQFVSSPFRENIFYDVVFKECLTKPFQDLCEFVADALDIEQTLKPVEPGKGALNEPALGGFLTAAQVIGKLGPPVRTPKTPSAPAISGSSSVGIIYCRKRETCEEVNRG